MNYIRTKNGHICKIRNKQKRFDGEYDTWYVGNNVSLLYNHDHNSIDKEADTIEELCDGIIVENKYNRNSWFFMEMDEFNNEKERLTNWTYTAYIKTDKGLIYVAKLNEKGELELL